MFQGFIHPLLAWGALAAAVPLIIHLFNRQRHKPMQWAAMKFVLEAYKRTRRRAQVENLILLLLRMAAVALLALAIARPFTGDDSPLTSLTERRRDVVLVIDDSASTDYRESVSSVHEAILDRAREILDELDGTRGDRVRLIAAAGRARLVSARSPEDAIALLTTLAEPAAEGLDLAALLADVVDFAEEEAAGTDKSAIEVRLLTDLQRNSFEPTFDTDEESASDEAVATAPLLRHLDRLEELGVRVTVEDLGAGVLTPPNLGIESLAPLGEVFGPGIATEIGVRVRNFGSGGRAGVRVALDVDGERQPTRKIDISGRSSAEATFQVLFKGAGQHTLVAHLVDGDRLAVDDERASVLFVPGSIRVLLVNGDPSSEIDRDEVGYLQAVLEPPTDDGRLPGVGSLYAPFLTTVIDASSFGAAETTLADYDIVVLANVSSVSERVMNALAKRVESGGALIIAMGDRSSDPMAIDSMNARGWRADGTGLLPAKLFRVVEVASRRDAYFRCASFDETHPALEFFADERWRPFLTEVPIYSFVQVEALENARVLARLDDEAKSPLLVERKWSRGKVLLWTTSIDRGWNRIADSPSTFIPFVHELFRYAARGGDPTYDLEVGATAALEVTHFPRGPYVVEPDGTRKALGGEPGQVAEGIWSLPAIGPVETPGLWRVEWEGGALPFAVCVDAAEGDLDRIPHAALEAQHSAWHILDAEGADAADDGDTPERGELWRWLAALALLALVLETVWSAWIGRGRRLA